MPSSTNPTSLPIDMHAKASSSHAPDAPKPSSIATTLCRALASLSLGLSMDAEANPPNRRAAPTFPCRHRCRAAAQTFPCHRRCRAAARTSRPRRRLPAALAAQRPRPAAHTGQRQPGREHADQDRSAENAQSVVRGASEQPACNRGRSRQRGRGHPKRRQSGARCERGLLRPLGDADRNGRERRAEIAEEKSGRRRPCRSGIPACRADRPVAGKGPKDHRGARIEPPTETAAAVDTTAIDATQADAAPDRAQPERTRRIDA